MIWTVVLVLGLVLVLTLVDVRSWDRPERFERVLALFYVSSF